MYSNAAAAASGPANKDRPREMSYRPSVDSDSTPEGSRFNVRALSFTPSSYTSVDPNEYAMHSAAGEHVHGEETRRSGEGSSTSGSSSGRRRHRRSGSGSGQRGAGRLPIFSALQNDSGSERGSSTRESGRSSPTNSIDSLTNSLGSLSTMDEGSVAPRKAIIDELVSKMSSPDESKAATAAKNVFDIVRETCPTWRQNQTQICRNPDVLKALTSLLHSQSERCRFEACRALGNIAFQNPGVLGQTLHPGVMDASGAADALQTDNCLTIVTTSGMLEGLMLTLKQGSVNSKHEAARVINNCAAYSPQAAETIAKYSGIIHELKALSGSSGRAQRTRAKAIGALNCLSTYTATRPYLISARIVEDALAPTLQQKKKIFGDQDEYKAMRADAVMAMANLVGKEENSMVINEPDGLKIVVKCLRHGLDGKVWAGITWTAYSSLLPLSNLTISDANKDILSELGLVELLMRCLTERVSKIEEALAIDCLDNMVFSAESRKKMVQFTRVSVPDILSRIIENEGAYPDGVARKARRILWLLSTNPATLLSLAQKKGKQIPHGAHIFLNYCPADQQLAKKINLIKDSLEGCGYPLWMKPTCAEGEMAEAIISAAVVILCVTRAFKEAGQCRISGEIAFETGKQILLLTLEEGFVADSSWGWLGRIAASSQCIVFHGDLSAAVYKLQNALSPFKSIARKSYGSHSPNPSLTSSPPSRKSFSPSTSPSIQPRSSSGSPAVPRLGSAQSPAMRPLAANEVESQGRGNSRTASTHASPEGQW